MEPGRFIVPSHCSTIVSQSFPPIFLRVPLRPLRLCVDVSESPLDEPMGFGGMSSFKIVHNALDAVDKPQFVEVDVET